MAKTKPIKWALKGDEPEDLPEFLSNDDILQKHRNGKKADVDWPGKGPFTFRVRRLQVKDNKNGDDRISAMLVIDEPKDSDAASWNGYLVWDGFNVTEQGAPFLKRFLKGLGLSWKDFMNKSKQDGQDPPHIVQIGGVKFEGSKDPTVRATVRVRPADDYNDDEHMEIGRYLPVDDDADDGAGEDEATADFSTDENSPTYDAVAAADALRWSLQGEGKAALAKRVKKHDKKADPGSMSKKKMIAFIVEHEVTPF